MPVLHPCGEHAWLLDLEDNRAVHRWAAAVRHAELPGVLEVVPGLTTLLVTLDPETTNSAELRRGLQCVTPGPDRMDNRGITSSTSAITVRISTRCPGSRV